MMPRLTLQDGQSFAAHGSADTAEALDVERPAKFPPLTGAFSRRACKENDASAEPRP